ncbi:hypothetical protein [Streptomyces sp. B6B3]|uniref:hypothetical protein n=1 Tax=Streptomyces sp. B6B3 TaxID=3153570 RepID=UPI00325E3FAC
MTSTGHTQEDTAARLRDLLATLGIDANVQPATVGLRPTVVIQPLPVADARRLVDALADGELRRKVREANRLSETNRLSRGDG